MSATPTPMTKAARDGLAKLVRQRERLAKAAAAERAAALMADFEAQMATIYSVEDEAWKDVTSTMDRLMREADDQIGKRCRERGIPEEFRPHLRMYWSDRGDNFHKERRAELRHVAERQIMALERQTRLVIEQRSVEAQAALLASGLTTDEARQFLATMPTATELMPVIDAKALAAALPGGIVLPPRVGLEEVAE